MPKTAKDAFDLLEMNGTLAIGQFWPEGNSDADTTKLVLSIGPDGTRVRRAGKNAFEPTDAYDDAVMVVGRKKDGDLETKPVMKEGVITVRLQRVDAPELHYRPDARGSEGKLKGTGLVADYRQRQAETATVRLRDKLAEYHEDPLPCLFTSQLDPDEGPGAAIDKYGRFVGDIILPDGTNLNLWLLEQGLAVVAMYDSMLPHEIHESIEAWKAGRPNGIAKHYSGRFLKFDPDLRKRPPGSLPDDEGRARFMHPKFFRRQVTWFAFREAGLFEGDFPDWLVARDEECRYADEFLERRKKAPKYPLYDPAVDGDGIGWEPEDFIFKEAPSTLERRGKNGSLKPVKKW